jgi:hypothetical protein
VHLGEQARRSPSCGGGSVTRIDRGHRNNSSDYPHWTYDDPRWLVKHLPEHAREAIMFRNGIETYKLPETVPALDGQVRVF